MREHESFLPFSNRTAWWVIFLFCNALGMFAVYIADTRSAPWLALVPVAGLAIILGTKCLPMSEKRKLHVLLALSILLFCVSGTLFVGIGSGMPWLFILTLPLFPPAHFLDAMHFPLQHIEDISPIFLALALGYWLLYAGCAHFVRHTKGPTQQVCCLVMIILLVGSLFGYVQQVNDSYSSAGVINTEIEPGGSMEPV